MQKKGMELEGLVKSGDVVLAGRLRGSGLGMSAAYAA